MWYVSCVTKPITVGVMGTFIMGNDEKGLKLRVNNSENKRHMGLKFCLSQFVMEANLFLEYQKNLRISILFCVDLTWNYPPCKNFQPLANVGLTALAPIIETVL